MRIVQLQADNFKRLVAVEITPEGDVVEVTGKNGSGKSSVLDAIYVALVGRSAAPPRPIRQGQEQSLIKLDLGEMIVTRTFTAKEGGTYTDTLKVENAEGMRYPSPQSVLDALLGEIGFDPFEFCQMKAAEQAETLLGMVPLPIDLDKMNELDQSDYLKRRDINRDLAAAKAQRDALPVEEMPDKIPDRQALLEELGNAANHNADVERERSHRESLQMRIDTNRHRAAELKAEIETIEQRAAEDEKVLAAKEPLAELIDTEALRQTLSMADRVAAAVQRQSQRTELAATVVRLENESKALTEAMETRDAQRKAALAGAKMPIEGLAFALDEKGKPVVQFGGVPFEQASTAEQLRASTAIAMSANPSLRVLRVKDGSLLDDDSMRLLAGMAKDEDFQLWIERVGTGGVGVVMENGAVATKPAEKKAKPKAADKPEGALV